MGTTLPMMDHINPDNAQQPIGFGTHLRATREALQLLPKDVAARLHLNPRIIHIIEQEDFANGPPAIFMRGYLRSYARLLNIPDSETNIALKALGLNIQPSSAAPPRLKETNNVVNNERYIKLVTYLVLGVSAILVGIWWESHSRSFTGDTIIPILAQQNVTPAIPAAESTPTAPPPQQPLIVAENNSETKLPVKTSNQPPIAIAKNPVLSPPMIAVPSHDVKTKTFPAHDAPVKNNLPLSVPEPGLDIYE